MRSGKDGQLDVLGDFKKIDQLLSEKKGQKPKNRARDIESVLDWMHNKDLSPGDVKDSLDDFNQLLSVPAVCDTPDERDEDVENILNWMRSGKQLEMDTPNDNFRTLDHLFLDVPD